jgi:hypothetical protein
MPYGNLLADVVQGSTANTPPVFKDGNGTTIGTLCRAWVNFNGTGTVAIRASFNVSSITDNGVGLYTINLTNAMPDTNYAFIGTARWNTTNVSIMVLSSPSNGTKTTSAFAIGMAQSNTAGYADSDEVNLSVFR